MSNRPEDNPGQTGPMIRAARAAAQRRIRVALDQEPGDLLLTGGQVVNVFNRRVEPADVVIADGRIAGVGCYSWRASQTISVAGQVILPGLIDAHIHLESTLLTPAAAEARTTTYSARSSRWIQILATASGHSSWRLHPRRVEF